MMIENLKDKKILILGFGREGQDTFLFLRRLFPRKELGIADKLEFKNLDKKVQKLILYEKCSRRVRLHLGGNYLKALKDYDVIIKSPGIPPKIIAPFLTKKQRITSQTEIFFENCPNKIIGVTATKGKGITTSLIHKILSKSGIKAHLVGNIGKPVLSYLLKGFQGRTLERDEVFVYELSSHQLYNLKKSPQIAVFLNIYPDHLDYYKNFKEYLEAKANITKYQTKKDYLIYNCQNKNVKEVAKKSKAKKIPIPINYRARLRFLKSRRADEFFTNMGIKKGIPLLNIMAAITVGKILRISDENIKRAISQFKSLPHRLEYIGQYRGIKFYNDSASSVPEATISALNILGNKVETIFLGGSDKKLNFKNLAKMVLKSQIKNVILFPTTGKKIWQEIIKFSRGQVSRKLPKHFFVDNMKEAVKLAYKHTQKGKISLLSPASASFSLFRDYEERGNLFKKYIKKFGKK